MSTFLVASWNNEKTHVKLPFRAGQKILFHAGAVFPNVYGEHSND